MVIAHSFPQDGRLFVGRNGEVPVGRVLARRLRHLQTFGVLDASLAQLHPAQNRDHAEEHDDAHETADDQTFATRDKGIDLAA